MVRVPREIEIEDVPLGADGQPIAKVGRKMVKRDIAVRSQGFMEARAAEGEGLFADALDAKTPLGELIPSMAQVKAVPTNGLSILSAFTGAGGGLLGFKMTGWQEVMSIEFVKAARETLAMNYGSSMVDPDEVFLFVQQWLSDHPDSSLHSIVRYNVPRKARGVFHTESVDWEGMLVRAVRSGDADLLEAVHRLRYDASFEMITRRYEQGNALIWGDDIRALDPVAAMEVMGLKAGDLDCYLAGPPCRSYSNVGLREGAWGHKLKYSDEREQRTDDLFYEAIRTLAVFRPKSFVAENVAGIEMGEAGAKVMGPLLAEFKKLGYRVEIRRHHAQLFGVPQKRTRVIFMGVREDLIHSTTGKPVMPAWPREMSYTYTVRDALEHAGESSPEEIAEAWLGTRKDLLSIIGEMPHKINWRRKRLQVSKSEVIEEAVNTAEAMTSNSDEIRNLAAKIADDLIEVSVVDNGSEEAEDLDEDGRVPENEYRYTTGIVLESLDPGGSPLNKYYSLVRCHPDLPSPTITATSAMNVPAAGPCHPTQTRKFTVNELRSLFTFPRDFILPGTIEQQGERMGRSAPPLMMKAIAETLAETLADAVFEGAP